LSYVDDAAFYRGAVLLGLIRGDEIIGWAGAKPSAPTRDSASRARRDCHDVSR
jgi:hypothetical protein